MRKIAFVNSNLIVCGGIITNFEYVSRLRKLGYEAFIIANQYGELERYYDIKHDTMDLLETLTDEDVIIANRWEQCEELEKYKGRKIQLVQGDDTIYYKNHVDLPKLIQTRNNPNWELIGVSEYALKNWKRGVVIPNGINERFFTNIGMERDIECLVEGNNEPNKNIHYAIEKAREYNQKVTWMGRETGLFPGVETITNPPQREIPFIYQRSKHFFKYSHSEGFSLPILEAMASGCIVHTWDMGGNDFCIDGYNCWISSYDETKNKEIVKNAIETAKGFTWDKALDKLLFFLT
jgi:glycosyltransferase involved in cell wall biosynthesis